MFYVQIEKVEVTGTLLIDGTLDLTRAGLLSSMSTTGGEIITITGSNFGPSTPRSYVSSVHYGNDVVGVIALQNCSFITPHTMLACLTAPGVGSQLNLQVCRSHVS